MINKKIIKKLYTNFYKIRIFLKKPKLIKNIINNDSDCLLITNLYPSEANIYQNAFIHSKVKAYKENGLQVDIVKISTEPYILKYEYENIDIYSMDYETLSYILERYKYKVIMVHFLNNGVWNIISKYKITSKIFIWAHGFEIQSWERRKHNFTTLLEQKTAKKISDEKQSFWYQVLQNLNGNLKIIFVSQYLADSVMKDLNLVLNKNQYYVIHNFINTRLFAYLPKHIDQRKKILSIRPYANANYANDLSIKAIVELSMKPYFDELEFRIIGDGVLFDEMVKPIKKFKNVIVEKKFLRQEEIARLHKEYGIFLCPSRMDTQGVSRDEAMSSGLVPITNNIAAIPEFTDHDCAILADENDYYGLAKGISMLYENPKLFQKMSKEAADRVRNQSDYVYTIGKELELLSESR